MRDELRTRLIFVAGFAVSVVLLQAVLFTGSDAASVRSLLGGHGLWLLVVSLSLIALVWPTPRSHWAIVLVLVLFQPVMNAIGWPSSQGAEGDGMPEMMIRSLWLYATPISLGLLLLGVESPNQVPKEGSLDDQQPTQD